MAKILYLAHRIPYPPNKGDKIRSWHFLKHIMDHHDVSLGYFIDDPDDREHIAFLKQKSRQHCAIERSPAQMKRKALWGFIKGTPLSIEAYNSKDMYEFVRHQVDEIGVEAIYVFSSAMAQFVLPFAGEIPIIMDFCDVDSAKWSAYSFETSLLNRFVYSREGRKLSAYETTVSEAVNQSVFVSEEEANFFISRQRGDYSAAITSLRNGVDCEYFNTAAIDLAQPEVPSVSFTGAMDYKPNVDAIVWFVDHCWVNVRKAIPTARLYIVGGKPLSELLSVNGVNGIVVTGRVADVRPYIASSQAVIAPLQIARGIQNKVLEAMSMSRPVVATSEAFTGIEAVMGEDIIIADAPVVFADAVIALLNDTDYGDRMGEKARASVIRNHSWATSYAKLDFILGSIIK